MHIVISGYFGFGNEGDEAILQSMIDALRHIHPTIVLTVLSHNPEQTKTHYKVHAVNRWKLTTVIKALKQADGLISGGGSLLQDKTSMKSIPYYTGIIHLAKLYKKPIFVYAQGMGPITHPISKFLTRLAINRRVKITVRDDKSRCLLEDLNITQPISEVPDAVFGLKYSLQESTWLSSLNLKNYIAVSLRPWTDHEVFTSELINILDDLSSEGFPIVFIPMHGVDDTKAAKDVSNAMSQPSFHVPADTPLNEKLMIMKHAEALLGMRLHALIFSSIVGTPFGAFSYDPKIDALTHQVKQPLLTHVNNPEQTDLKKHVFNFIHKRTYFKHQLLQSVDELKQAADYTAQQAIDYFKG